MVNGAASNHTVHHTYEGHRRCRLRRLRRHHQHHHGHAAGGRVTWKCAYHQAGVQIAVDRTLDGTALAWATHAMAGTRGAVRRPGRVCCGWFSSFRGMLCFSEICCSICATVSRNRLPTVAENAEGAAMVLMLEDRSDRSGLGIRSCRSLGVG